MYQASSLATWQRTVSPLSLLAAAAVTALPLTTLNGCHSSTAAPSAPSAQASASYVFDVFYDVSGSTTQNRRDIYKNPYLHFVERENDTQVPWMRLFSFSNESKADDLQLCFNDMPDDLDQAENAWNLMMHGRHSKRGTTLLAALQKLLEDCQELHKPIVGLIDTDGGIDGINEDGGKKLREQIMPIASKLAAAPNLRALYILPVDAQFQAKLLQAFRPLKDKLEIADQNSADKAIENFTPPK